MNEDILFFFEKFTNALDNTFLRKAWGKLSGTPEYREKKSL